MNKIEQLKDVCDWIEGVHPDCKYDPLVSLHTVMEALESEGVVAEKQIWVHTGLDHNDVVAALRHVGFFKPEPKYAATKGYRVRILAVKEE